MMMEEISGHTELEEFLLYTRMFTFALSGYDHLEKVKKLRRHPLLSVVGNLAWRRRITFSALLHNV